MGPDAAMQSGQRRDRRSDANQFPGQLRHVKGLCSLWFFCTDPVQTARRWHSPHIANPFILMIFTGNLWVAMFLSFFFEIIELLMVATTSGFALFAGAANSLENLSDVLLDDAFIQPVLGIAVAALYMWYVRAPRLWGNFWTERRNWMYWAVWYVLLMVTQTTYGLNLNDDDPTGFPIGGIICCSLMAVIFAFLVQNEPDWQKAWEGRTMRSRIEFWMGAITIYFSFYIVTMFDFFFGSAAQTWLLAGIWLLGLLLWAYARGRGRDLLELVNWQTAYVRGVVERGRQALAGFNKQS